MMVMLAAWVAVRVIRWTLDRVGCLFPGAALAFAAWAWGMTGIAAVALMLWMILAVTFLSELVRHMARRTRQRVARLRRW